MACVLDAIGDMQLEPGLQAHAVGVLQQQFPAVDVDDLPALTRRVVPSAPVNVCGCAACLAGVLISR